MKNKIIYLSAIGLFASLGILGIKGNAYTEAGGTGRLVQENLIIFLLIGLIVGFISFHYFKKIFPKGYAQQNNLGKILVPLVFPILAFAMTVGIGQFANTNFGNQERIEIDGFIESKYKKPRRKQRFDYFVRLRDSATGKTYLFELNRNTYNLLGDPGRWFTKCFTKAPWALYTGTGFRMLSMSQNLFFHRFCK